VPRAGAGSSREPEGVDLAVFAQRGWLSRQPAAFRTRFVELGRRLVLRRGDPVFVAGDPPGGLYGILAGGIGVEVGTQRLMPRLGHIHRAGAWFGTKPVLAGGARKMGFHAVEDSTLLYLPLPRLQALLDSDAEARLRLGDLANEGMMLASEAARELLIADATRRIVAVMLRVTAAADGVPPDDPRGFLVTQNQLAEMANASRHSVWRALRELAARGWIAKRYHHVRLLDVEALENYAYAEE
jgi:CRP-like cAMP-binding protein